MVTDKTLLINLITMLQALELKFDAITLDWFALQENEAFVTESGLLIHDKILKVC